MSRSRVSPKYRHHKEPQFLASLGEHCKKIRKKLGYSIDRLARESEGLSTSVIHRLEEGAGPVTVTNLFRYARALRLHPKELLSFDLPSSVIAPRDQSVQKGAFKKLLPLYDLEAAAGKFGDGVEVEMQGWIDVSAQLKKLDEKMFVCRARGRSMEPLIHDGDYLVFRANPTGSKQGRVVLAQHRSIEDPDSGGSFTVKEYRSVKASIQDGSWRHQEVHLISRNPEFETILIRAKDAEDFRIVAELIEVLPHS